MKARNLGIFFGILAVLIVLLVVLNNAGNDKDTVYGVPKKDLYPETRALLNDKNYDNIILPNELDRMIADKKSFFVYYFSASCSHCKFTTPKIKPIVDELGINFHEFNLLEYQNYLGKMNINATPTLVYYKDGVEAERMEGGLKEAANTVGYTLDDFRTFFDKYKPSGND